MNGSIDVGVTWASRLGLRLGHLPNTSQETMHAFDTGGIPVRTMDPRSHEHHEETQSISAVLLDVRVRGLDVPARLRHLPAFEDDRSLRSEERRVGKECITGW